MATVGRSNIEITATDRQARRTISGFFRDLENTGQRIGQTMRRMNPFEALERGMNVSAQALERYKTRFLSAIDQMNAKATQSKKMMDLLPETSRIQRIDRFFLGIGDHLEQMAKRGTAANLALAMLGRNASLKEILERIKLVNQGLARMQAVATTSAIVLGIFTAGMVKLSNAVDGRLLPAAQEFKRVWLSALKPFAQIWTDFALLVVKAGTALGRFVQQVNQVNPAMTKMAGMFLFLFTAISLLLSPMAIGIGRALGMRAAFTVLFNAFKPLILGFLRIAGMASIVSGALVILGGILLKLWKNSEVFRNAIISGWTAIKNTMLSAIQPLIPALRQMWTSFVLLLNALVGGKGSTISSFWQGLGDAIGRVVQFLVSVAVPLLRGQLTLLVNLIQIRIHALIVVLNAIRPVIQGIVTFIRGVFATLHGNTARGGNFLQSLGLSPATVAQIQAMLNQVRIAFMALVQFIRTISPQIGQVVMAAFQLIRQVVITVMPVIVSVVRTGWTMIKTIMTAIWPVIVPIVQGALMNIKNVIVTMLTTIQNVILLFTNLLRGNWSAAWQNLKTIAYQALVMIRANMLTMLNAIRTSFVVIWNGMVAFLSAIWNRIVVLAFAIWNRMTAFFVGVGNRIKQSVVTNWNSIVSFLTGCWNRLVGMTTTVWNTIKTTVVTAFQWMYNHNYYFEALVHAIITVWNTAKQGTITKWNLLKTFLATTWNSIKQVASVTWNGIKTLTVTIWNGIKAVIMAVWNTLRPWLVANWNSIRAVASSTWNAIKNTISTAVNGAKSVVMTAWNQIKAVTSSTFNTVRAIVTSIGSSIKSALSGLAGQALNWGRNLLNNFISGMRFRLGALRNVAREAVGSVSRLLGFHSPAEEGPGADADKWMINLMDMLAQQIRSRAPQLQMAAMEVANQLMALRQLRTGPPFGLNREPIASALANGLKRVGGSSHQKTVNITVHAKDAPLTEERLQRILRRVEMMEHGW